MNGGSERHWERLVTDFERIIVNLGSVPCIQLCKALNPSFLPDPVAFSASCLFLSYSYDFPLSLLVSDLFPGSGLLFLYA